MLSTGEIDFLSAAVFDLEFAKKNEVFIKPSMFLEKIFQFAEFHTGSDPSWGFSDQSGIHIAGNFMKRVLLSSLPKGIGKDVEKATYFAVSDISRA